MSYIFILTVLSILFGSPFSPNIFIDAANTFFVNNIGNLEIKWSEGNHHSCYVAKWLKQHCYTIKNKQNYKSPYKFWKSNFNKYLSKIKIKHDDIIKSDEALLEWLKLLVKYGFAIVKNSPTKKNQLLKF